MDLSECCGAPVLVEFVSEGPNTTDDDYDFKIPVRVCSCCGKVLSRYPTFPAAGEAMGGPQGASQGGPQGVSEGGPKGVSNGGPQGVSEGRRNGGSKGGPKGGAGGKPR